MSLYQECTKHTCNSIEVRAVKFVSRVYKTQILLKWETDPREYSGKGAQTTSIKYPVSENKKLYTPVTRDGTVSEHEKADNGTLA
jgi:hypothetical protein